MVNLESFKLSKKQMNKISGGKSFDCHISDVGLNGFYEGIEFDMTLNDFPDKSTFEDAQNILKAQFGPDFEISCI